MIRTRLQLMAVLALTPLLSGCSALDRLFVDVCPAVGWIQHVDVELTGETAEVAVVELCAEGVCSAPSTDPADPTPLKLPATSDPEGFKTFTPAPTHTVLPYTASRVDNDTWRISFDMRSPDHATIRALSSAGNVLTEKDVELEWTRIGGSERCGGPSETDPITLEVARNPLNAHAGEAASVVNEHPRGPARVTTGKAYAEYQAEIEAMDAPLPNGAAYPQGVPEGLDAGASAGGVMESGGGRTVARFTWLCAWETEYLAAVDGAEGKRQGEAESALEGWSRSPFYQAFDPGKQWVTAVLEPMRSGDPAGVKQDQPQSCAQAFIVNARPSQ